MIYQPMSKLFPILPVQAQNRKDSRTRWSCRDGSWTGAAYAWCLFVCIQKSSKRLCRSGPIFLLDLMWPKERLMENRVFKYLPLTKFVFANFEIQQIFLRNPQHFCLFLFYNVYIEKMFTIKIEYRCEEALKPSIVVRQFQKY